MPTYEDEEEKEKEKKRWTLKNAYNGLMKGLSVKQNVSAENLPFSIKEATNKMDERKRRMKQILSED